MQSACLKLFSCESLLQTQFFKHFLRKYLSFKVFLFSAQKEILCILFMFSRNSELSKTSPFQNLYCYRKQTLAKWEKMWRKEYECHIRN